jgi:hypothetical protein
MVGWYLDEGGVRMDDKKTCEKILHALLITEISGLPKKSHKKSLTVGRALIQWRKFLAG